MNFENIPRLTITHASTLCCGFIMATWCKGPEMTEKTLRQSKPGFSLSLPIQVESELKHLQHKTKFNLVQNRENGSLRPCIMDTAGLILSIESGQVFISSDVKGFQKLAKIAFAHEKKILSIRSAESAGNIAPCIHHPTIHYGDSL